MVLIKKLFVAAFQLWQSGVVPSGSSGARSYPRGLGACRRLVAASCGPELCVSLASSGDAVWSRGPWKQMARSLVAGAPRQEEPTIWALGCREMKSGFLSSRCPWFATTVGWKLQFMLESSSSWPRIFYSLILLKRVKIFLFHSHQGSDFLSTWPLPTEEHFSKMNSFRCFAGTSSYYFA